MPCVKQRNLVFVHILFIVNRGDISKYQESAANNGIHSKRYIKFTKDCPISPLKSEDALSQCLLLGFPCCSFLRC